VIRSPPARRRRSARVGALEIGQRQRQGGKIIDHIQVIEAQRRPRLRDRESPARVGQFHPVAGHRPGDGEAGGLHRPNALLAEKMPRRRHHVRIGRGHQILLGRERDAALAIAGGHGKARVGAAEIAHQTDDLIAVAPHCRTWRTHWRNR
jgi:hypothetical protein